VKLAKKAIEVNQYSFPPKNQATDQPLALTKQYPIIKQQELTNLNVLKDFINGPRTDILVNQLISPKY
jgi:hypothetical protein